MHRRIARPALLFCALFFFFLATSNSQTPKASDEKPVEWAGLPQLAGGWHTLHADKGQVSIGFGTMRIAPSSGTNLFRAPGGGFNMVNAPMVLAAADREFTLVARVSAQLVERYDVGALVLYQDETHWAKICFENSAHKEATVVTVVTRERSDDANSETIASPFVYLALARHGDEFTLHFSRDGREWRLARHFEQAFADTLKVGFAAHSDANPHFVVSFSELAYRPTAPHNMRQLEADDLPTREPHRTR